MAASADVIEMRAAIEQVLAELESIPSLIDYQKAALEAFKRKFALHKRQRSCTSVQDLCRLCNANVVVY